MQHSGSPWSVVLRVCCGACAGDSQTTVDRRCEMMMKTASASASASASALSASSSPSPPSAASDGLVGNCYVTIIYTENEFEVAGRSHLLAGAFHWLVITIQPLSCGRNRVFGKMQPGHPHLSILNCVRRRAASAAPGAPSHSHQNQHQCACCAHSFCCSAL